MGRDQKVERMRGVPLFSLCTDKELRRLAALCDVVGATAGETLTKEGQPGNEFFVIEEGSADVSLSGTRLAALDAGDFFGEMALLDQGPRAATVTAVTDMQLYLLSAKAFQEAIYEAPSVALKVMKGLASRLRNTEKAPTY